MDRLGLSFGKSICGQFEGTAHGMEVPDEEGTVEAAVQSSLARGVDHVGRRIGQPTGRDLQSRFFLVNHPVRNNGHGVVQTGTGTTAASRLEPEYSGMISGNSGGTVRKKYGVGVIAVQLYLPCMPLSAAWYPEAASRES